MFTDEFNSILSSADVDSAFLNSIVSEPNRAVLLETKPLQYINDILRRGKQSFDPIKRFTRMILIPNV